MAKKTFYGDRILFKHKSCLSKFSSHHLCISEKPSELLNLEIELDDNIDILTLDTCSNNSILNILKRRYDCFGKLQAIENSVGKLSQGYSYVRLCLPYELVYKHKCPSAYTNLLCKCTDNRTSTEASHCSFIVKI